MLAFVSAAPPGSRLPAERQLAERLGVSRSTLRAALARLELLGHVEVKHGSGVYVRKPDLTEMFGLLASSSGASRADALAIRHVLEPGLAYRAARGQDAQGMRAAATDKEFHVALAMASGIDLAATLVGSLVELSGDANLSDELHTAQHAAITAAVEAGDPRSAAGAARLHLTTLRP